MTLLYKTGFDIKLTTEKGSWEETRDMCEDMGGQLVHNTLKRYVGRLRTSYKE